MSSINSIYSFKEKVFSLDPSKRLPIEQLQDLEIIRKALKKDFLASTDGREVYSSIKRKLHTLKQQHLPLRVAAVAKECWKKETSLPVGWDGKAIFSSHPFPQKNSPKEDCKYFWIKLEGELCAYFSQEDPEVVSCLEKITLVHGTGSAILPFLPYTQFSLIPTGALMRSKKIAPMCGELKRGVGSSGINNTFLSLETIRNLKRSWDYALNYNSSFRSDRFKDIEKVIKDSLGKLSKLDPLNDSSEWTQEILRLIQLKQYQPEAFHQAMKQHANEISFIKHQIESRYVRLEKLMLEALEMPVAELRKTMKSAEEGQKFEEKWEEKGISLHRGWNTLKDVEDFESFLELVGYNTLIREDLDHHIGKAITHILKMKIFGIQEFINLSYFPLTYFTKPIWQKLAAHPRLKEALPPATWEKIHKKSKEPMVRQEISNSSFPLKNSVVSGIRTLKETFHFSPYSEDENELIVRLVLDIYIRETIERRLSNQIFPLKERLAELQQLLDPPLVFLSETDLEKITNPFPILLASTSYRPQKLKTDGDEFSAREIAFGKKGIDLIFVKKEHLEITREWLEKQHLSDHVALLDIDPILTVSEKLPLYHASHQIEEAKDLFSADALYELNLILDADASVFYKKTYPDGRPRHIHGLPHASGAAFWAYILANKFHELGIHIEVSKELLILFAYLHDSGREDDGPDKKEWEMASACHGEAVAVKAFPQRMRELPILKDAVAGKDDKISHEVTNTKKIIHAADTLEIHRCLTSADKFHPDELWLFGVLSHEEIAELTTHAREFILLREDPQLKAWLEKCPSAFAGHFQILEHACLVNPQKFGWLAHQAAFGIQAFCGNTLSPLSTERERIEFLCKPQ